VPELPLSVLDPIEFVTYHLNSLSDCFGNSIFTLGLQLFTCHLIAGNLSANAPRQYLASDTCLGLHVDATALREDIGMTAVVLGNRFIRDSYYPN